MPPRSSLVFIMSLKMALRWPRGELGSIRSQPASIRVATTSRPTTLFVMEQNLGRKNQPVIIPFPPDMESPQRCQAFSGLFPAPAGPFPAAAGPLGVGDVGIAGPY